MDVQVLVLRVMAVRVAVTGAVRVNVFVRVLAAAPRLLEAPGHVDEAERDQGIGREIAAHAFEPLQPVQRRADRDADETDQDRAEHVAGAAERGDEHGLATRPVARRRHRHEGQVMVGPEDGVDEADRDGRQQQQAEFHGHAFPRRRTVTTQRSGLQITTGLDGFQPRDSPTGPRTFSGWRSGLGADVRAADPVPSPELGKADTRSGEGTGSAAREAAPELVFGGPKTSHGASDIDQVQRHRPRPDIEPCTATGA